MTLPRTRGRVLFVRLPSWLGAAKVHPRDLMWPVKTTSARSMAERAGWTAGILDLHVEDCAPAAVVARIVSFRPDVLLVDSRTPTVPLALDIARAVRRWRPETRLWGVGQHASVEPEDLLSEEGFFDGTVMGELDAVVPRLLDVGAEHAVDGCAVWDGQRIRRLGSPGEVVDLDALPPTDPSGLLADRYHMKSFRPPTFQNPRWGFLLSSRGCPYDCTFCSPTLRQSHGRRFRARSAEAVVDDLRRLHRDYGLDSFYFIDDLFSFDRQRVVDICDALRKRNSGIRWAIQTRSDALDRDLLRRLKEGGCFAVKLGVESGSDAILRNLRKGEDTACARAAARDIREVGLSLTACFMVGNPGETEEDIRSSIRFAKELRADLVQVAFNTPYPGSRQYDERKDERDKQAILHGGDHYEGAASCPCDLDAATLQRLQRRFYLEYFLHPPQLLQLARQRSLFALFDPRERALVASTLRYLLPRTAKAGADPRREVDRGHAAPARAPVARHKVCLTREELGLVARFMGGRRSLPGARGAFEQAAAAYLGTRQVFALESGRAALAFGLRALGLPPGAVIVLPNYSFYSSVVVVEALGFEARFAPIDPETMALAPEGLAACIDGASCVIVNEPFGQVAQVEAIDDICRRAGVPWIEDASQSTGAGVGGRKVGSFGTVGVFSLVVGKNLQTFGGGLATSSDPAVLRRMNDLWDSPAVSAPSSGEVARVREGLVQWAATTSLGFRSFTFPALRVLSSWAPERLSQLFKEERQSFDPAAPLRRLLDFKGELGLRELRELDDRNEKRRRAAFEIMERLNHVESLRFQRFRADADHTFNALCLRVTDASSLQRALLRAGVDTREDYMEWFGDDAEPAEQVLYLPNHPGMSADDLRAVAEAVAACLSSSSGTRE